MQSIFFKYKFLENMTINKDIIYNIIIPFEISIENTITQNNLTMFKFFIKDKDLDKHIMDYLILAILYNSIDIIIYF